MTVRRGDPCTIEACGKPVVGRGWCSMHYARWRTYGDPLYETRRYAPQAETCSVETCPEPTHGLGVCKTHYRRVRNHGETTDYGQFGMKSGTRLVHRISYQYLVGPIAKGLHLDHLCRVRACLRPTHLDPVLPRENIRRGDQGAFWGYVPEPIPAKPKAEKPLACTECGGDRQIYKRTLCRPCYRKWLKDPNVVRPRSLTSEQRFWAKAEKTDRCWLWTAAVNPGTGYGHFSLRHGVMVQVHRHSYELAKGAIPDGYDVHHTCHVRRCLRPDHLIATTRSQNLAERKVRRTPTD
jgi:hypothetical protein